MQRPVNNVFHPTDFSEASHVAFDHALAIAIARKATLTIMNADKGFKGDDWSKFPGVSDTLKRWGLFDESNVRRDILEKLSVKIKKHGVVSSDPAETILEYLTARPDDLVVMSTQGKEGLPRLLKGSITEKVTRMSGTRFLLVPAGCSGFVSKRDGSLSLKRILVPVVSKPDPNAAVIAASRAAGFLGHLPVALHAVHIGDQMPSIDLPTSSGWTWSQSIRTGDVIEGILDTALKFSADLIVMTTDGPDSFRDLFRGSHLHRVVRGAHCPVTAVSVPG